MTEDERRMVMPTRFGTGDFMVACSAFVYLVVDWRSIRFGACEREFCAERWKWSQVSICLDVPSSILCPSNLAATVDEEIVQHWYLRRWLPSLEHGAATLQRPPCCLTELSSVVRSPAHEVTIHTTICSPTAGAGIDSTHGGGAGDGDAGAVLFGQRLPKGRE